MLRQNGGFIRSLTGLNVERSTAGGAIFPLTACDTEAVQSIQFEWLGLAVALGCGLLVGVERERRKGRGSDRALAGVRTFSVTALIGALLQTLQFDLLLAIGAVLVLILALISHLRSDASDPGITTPLALFVTFLLGVTAMRDAVLAAGGAAMVTILLASQSRLHRFATQTLHANELRDGLILAGAALIVLPLVPAEPIQWLAGFNPRRIWGLVVLLLAAQTLGYIAMRAAGPTIGLALSGLASGFVSSTATHAAMGACARHSESLLRAAVAGAMMSNVATMLLLLLVALTVAPSMVGVLWPIFLAGSLGALIGASLSLWPAVEDPRPPVLDRVFDLSRAMIFAAMLTGMTGLAAWAGARYGEAGVSVAAAIAGFVDVHAGAASVATLVQGGRVEAQAGALPILLAFSTNTVSKLVAAWIGGGFRFAARVLPGLILLLGMVWSAWWWFC
jgi:uncharacterized membrane protein (DUF4010 family)